MSKLQELIEWMKNYEYDGDDQHEPYDGIMNKAKSLLNEQSGQDRVGELEKEVERLKAEIESKDKYISFIRADNL